MKSGSIFRILNARNLGLISFNIFLKTKSTSSSRPNRFGRKTVLCVWWNQEDVIYYELLKPGTVNAHRCHQQLIKLHRALRKKRPHQKRHDKLIFLHDNAPSLTSTMVQNYLERHSTRKCYPIPLTHQTWHLLTITCFRRWATRSLSGTSYEVRKWLDE